MHASSCGIDLLLDPRTRWRFSGTGLPELKHIRELDTPIQISSQDGTRTREGYYCGAWGQGASLYDDRKYLASKVCSVFRTLSCQTASRTTVPALRSLIDWRFADRSAGPAFAFATAIKPRITSIARSRGGSVQRSDRQVSLLAAGLTPSTFRTNVSDLSLSIADGLRLRSLVDAGVKADSYFEINQRCLFEIGGERHRQFEQTLVVADPERDWQELEAGLVPGQTLFVAREFSAVELPSAYFGQIIPLTEHPQTIDDYRVADILVQLHPEEGYVAHITSHRRSLRTFLLMNPIFFEMLVSHRILIQG